MDEQKMTRPEALAALYELYHAHRLAVCRLDGHRPGQGIQEEGDALCDRAFEALYTLIPAAHPHMPAWVKKGCPTLCSRCRLRFAHFREKPAQTQAQASLPLWKQPFWHSYLCDTCYPAFLAEYQRSASPEPDPTQLTVIQEETASRPHRDAAAVEEGTTHDQP